MNDYWERRYRDGGAVWGDRPTALAEEAAARCAAIRALKILVLGCGYGRNCAAFARTGAQVVGLDRAAAGLALARAARPAAAPVRYCRGDARALPFAIGAFDAVAALHLLHLLEAPDRPAAIREAARVMRPGGLLLATVFSRADPECPAGPGDGEPFTARRPDGKRAHFFAEAELRALCAGLQVLELAPVTEPGGEGTSAGLRHYFWVVARTEG